MEKKASRRQADKLKGIVHILMAAFGFAMMSFFVRLAGDLPTMEKAFFRNLVAALVSLVLVLKSGKRFEIHEGCLLSLLLRSAIGTLGIICNFWAIGHMEIADANILNKLSPFAAIIMSIFIIGEIPGRFEILTVIVAFLGAVFIVKPGTGVASLPAVVGVAGGIFAGTAYTFVRKLGMKGEKKETIVLFFSVFSTVICLLFMIRDFRPMSIRQFITLIMAGVSALAGQLNITAAYTYAPAKEISVFDYSQVIFAAVLGFIFFGEFPDIWSWTGYVIIIGTAIVTWRRNMSL